MLIVPWTGLTPDSGPIPKCLHIYSALNMHTTTRHVETKCLSGCKSTVESHPTPLQTLSVDRTPNECVCRHRSWFDTHENRPIANLIRTVLFPFPCPRRPNDTTWFAVALVSSDTSRVLAEDMGSPLFLPSHVPSPREPDASSTRWQTRDSCEAHRGNH